MAEAITSPLKEFRRSSGKTLDGMADFFEVDRKTVLRWEEKLPADRIIEVSKKTGIPREKLRPDLYEAAR